jgi:hypothetical protein
MGRSVLAIVAGFVVIAVLALGTDMVLRAARPDIMDANGRVDSAPWLVAILTYVFVYAVFGCWLAARLAPNGPMRHAMILGLLGLAFNVMGTIANWNTAPAWFHVVALALVLPAAWLGGWLRERQLAGGSASAYAAGSA